MEDSPQFFAQYPVRCVLIMEGGEEVEVRGEMVTPPDDPWSADFVVTAEEARRAIEQARCAS